MDNDSSVVNKEEEKYIKIPPVINTLVLSGGSVKAIGTLGSLDRCYEDKLLDNVDIYIGASAGAMISYLLAIGYSPLEMVIYLCMNNVFEDFKFIDIVSLANGDGAIDFAKVSNHLDKMTIDKLGFFVTLGKLREIKGKTLICATYNYTNDEIEYLGPDNYPDIPCITAIRMSAGLPFIFDKFNYMGCHYIDGGIGDNFPIQLADIDGRNVLGIMIMPERDETKNNEEKNMEFLYNLMFIPVHQIMEYKISQASERCKVIRLTLGKLKFFNFDINTPDILDLFSKGYRCTDESLKNLWD